MKTAIQQIKEAIPKWSFYTQDGTRVIDVEMLDELIREGMTIEKQQIIDSVAETVYTYASQLYTYQKAIIRKQIGEKYYEEKFK